MVPTTAPVLFILFFALTPTFARFTQVTCWYNLCVQQNAYGTWCYIPQAGDTRLTTCIGASADMSTVLDVHLRQGLSIAYYNGVGNEFLGGANYSLPSNHGIIRLCVSGQAGDGNYETLCVNASADNVLAGSPYCQVALPQYNVTDGCYEPPPEFVAGTGTGARTGTGTGTLSGFSSSYTGTSYTSHAHQTISQHLVRTITLTALVLALLLN